MMISCWDMQKNSICEARRWMCHDADDFAVAAAYDLYSALSNTNKL